MFDNDSVGLYDLLYNAITLETEGISTSLVLKHDGGRHEIKVLMSELHIEEEGGSLKVYVPRDEDAQDVCFKSKLPRRLAAWLMTDPSTHKAGKIDDSLLNVINAVVDCRVSAVNSILQEEGIPEIEIHDRNADSALDEALDTPPSVRTPRSSVLSSSSASEVTNDVTPLTAVNDYIVRSVPNAWSHRPQLFTYVPPADDHGYSRLLKKVVLLARSATFPEFGSFNMTSMLHGLPPRDYTTNGAKTSYGSTEWQHRAMIGAAGELFVRVYRLSSHA